MKYLHIFFQLVSIIVCCIYTIEILWMIFTADTLIAKYFGLSYFWIDVPMAWEIPGVQWIFAQITPESSMWFKFFMKIIWLFVWIVYAILVVIMAILWLIVTPSLYMIPICITEFCSDLIKKNISKKKDELGTGKW